jgi:FlaG/FlaF family flagellin (archaellin)
MPMTTLDDLRDPVPPTPGPSQRAAVAARAHQLGRRRRLAQLGGALAVVCVLAGGVAVVASGSGTSSNHVQVATLASVRGTTTNFEDGGTLHVTVTGDGGTFTVDAAPDGTFELHDLPPGTYTVKWDYESPPADAGTAGVDIGTALRTGRLTTELASGVNSVSITLPLR